MTYGRFFAMILTSTLVMFGLMYLNTYASGHVFFSETRAWMALLMGAVMAIVMLAWMASMYPSRWVNAAIFAGAAVVFALTLYLVRSQVTVSGLSYMRAMIPHHSIAVMTSTRAAVEDDARIEKLAAGITGAQRREIAEMRYLIADIAAGNTTAEVYEDPAPAEGSVEDALSNTLLAELDPAPIPADRAGALADDPVRCTFRYTEAGEPVLWTGEGGAGLMALNGVLVALEGPAEATAGGEWTADGLSMAVTPLGDEAGPRGNADLVFALQDGPRVGYRGVWSCVTG
ncbi:DUF305 domain-containing protein [Rhodobacterales bacterium HKCCE2091]|nr:DUF305 domain-containing protein [Rhodobacterales bacterium HKCCE2091]